jgi:putative SbcD/Mre11-related phosphoesterase
MAPTPLPTPKIEIAPGLWLDARRALWIAPLRALVVADLHWGYAAAHRAAGNLLPAWGDAEIARRLRALLADYAPRELIWLGDSLHTLAGRGAAEAFLREHADVALLEVTVLAGNHDHRWSRATARTLTRGKFYFHHGDLAAANNAIADDALEIIGHHHPAATWRDGAGGRVKLPALVASPRRLVLPAFSPWAGGAPWNARLAADEKLWAIAPRRIFAVRNRESCLKP